MSVKIVLNVAGIIDIHSIVNPSLLEFLMAEILESRSQNCSWNFLMNCFPHNVQTRLKMVKHLTLLDGLAINLLL